MESNEAQLAQEKMEKLLKEAKVLVATPCYGGMCAADYMRSMTGLAALSAQYGINISIITTSNDSLVTKARNAIAQKFLEEESLTHLMFIDADIAFNPDDVVKLILRDKDVVAGVYPLKRIDWESVKNSIDDKTTVDSLKRSGLIFTYGKMNPNGESYVDRTDLMVKVEDGLVEADAVGTGFMMIKRGVFEKMIDADPDNWYNDDKYEGRMTHVFFDDGLNKTTRMYVGEDWAFCEKWKSLGGEIWVDPSINLTHVGTYQFQGTLF